MGNFDFILNKLNESEFKTDGQINHYWFMRNYACQNRFAFTVDNVNSVNKNMLNFLGNNINKNNLKELLSSADMYLKTDIYLSALYMRKAWDYFLDNVTKKDIYDPHKCTRSDQFNTIFPCPSENEEEKNRFKFNSDYVRRGLACSNSMIQSVKDDISERFRWKPITEYIKIIGNIGAHDTENTNRNASNSLEDYLHELSFGKVALGLEITAYLLKRFFIFNNTESYRYDVDNIPLERYKIVNRISINDSNGANDSNREYLLPKNYCIGEHEYDEDSKQMPTYAVIKEYVFPDVVDSNEELNKKFKTMLERQNYIMTVTNDETKSRPDSVYIGIKDNTPYRYIVYSVPNKLEGIQNNEANSDKLMRIDTAAEYIYNNKDFYCKLAGIFNDIERKISNVSIRGVVKDNIWVYKKGLPPTYHPIFTGYELCKLPIDNKREEYEHSVAMVEEKLTGQNWKIGTVRAFMPDDDNGKFLASFFVLIFDLYCQKVHKDNREEQENYQTEALKKMRETFDEAKKDLQTILPGVTEYIGTMLSKMENAKKSDSSGRWDTDLSGISTIENITEMFNKASNNQTQPKILEHQRVCENNCKSSQINSSTDNLSESDKENVTERKAVGQDIKKETEEKNASSQKRSECTPSKLPSFLRRKK